MSKPRKLKTPLHRTHHEFFEVGACLGCHERSRRRTEVTKSVWRIFYRGEYLVLHRYDLGLLKRTARVLDDIDWEGLRNG